MNVLFLTVIVTLFIAAAGVAFIIIVMGDDNPADPGANGRDFFAVEEEYPTTGGQEMRPRF